MKIDGNCSRKGKRSEEKSKDKSDVDKSTGADGSLKFTKFKSTKQDNPSSIPSRVPKSTSAHIDVKSTKGKSTKRDRSVHDITPSNVTKSRVTNVTAKSTVPSRSRGSEGTSGDNDSEEVIGMSREEVRAEVYSYVIKKVGDRKIDMKAEYTHARKKGRDRIYKVLKREGKPIDIEEWKIEWEVLKDYRAKAGVESARIPTDIIERLREK